MSNRARVSEQARRIVNNSAALSIYDRRWITKQINTSIRVDRLADIRRGKGQKYIDIMNEIVGDNIVTRSRIQRLVWGRSIVAYQLSCEGYKFETIAEMFAMSIPATSFMARRVDEMLSNPRGYENEHSLFKEFRNRINNGIHADTN